MTRPLETGSTRYGIHKETDQKTEVFMLFPKKYDWFEVVRGNLKTFKKPSQEMINFIRRNHPDVSAMLKSLRNSEVISYAESGFIQYRNSIYVHHAYQFVRNDHSKIEIAAAFNPKRRSRAAVERELRQIMEKATSGVPHVDYFHHSLK